MSAVHLQSLTPPADPARQAAKALAGLRVDRRAAVRQRRRALPWDERIYPAYLALIGAGYVALILSGTPNVRIGRTRIAGTAAGSAATSCIGDLLTVLGLVTVAASLAAAVNAGPVVLWPEDARVLLPSPVSRALLLRRRLRVAYASALVLGAAASGLLILVEVALLSVPAAKALPGAIAVPLLIAATAVAAGWLVQAVPVLRRAARVISAVITVLVLTAAGAVAVELGRGGQLAGWSRLHRIGRLPGVSLLTDVAQPGTTGPRLIVTLLVLAAIVAALAIAGWLRAAHVSAEQVIARAGRAVAVRTALRLGYTSSAYVVRIGPARRARTRRRYLTFPGRSGPLLSKAALQEQGAWLPGRIALAVVAAGVLQAAFFARVSVTTINPDLAGGVIAGIAFAAVATRYADALRIDAELATPATSLPAGFGQLAIADLTIPAMLFALGGLVAAPLVAALGLQPWSQVPALAVFGILLGPAAASVAAFSATGSKPSPFLPAAAATAIRLRGVIASIIVMVGVTFARHPPALHGRPPVNPTDSAAITVMILGDAVLVGLAWWSGRKALLDAR